jgi:uncharacterized protein (TIGR02145 family)
MKKFYVVLCLAIASLTQLQAQAPQGFNYQATVRNSAGDLIVNANVYFKFNVIQGSLTAVPIFTETHYVPTDDLGQVNLVIGQGTPSAGTFSALDWSLGSYYLGIELDTGNGYLAMGTTQLLSVPYALYAENSGNATSAIPNLEAVLAENNSANNQQIKDLQDPTEAQDAVTKAYFENNTTSSGLSPGNNIGDILYWDGQSWESLEAPSTQSTLQFCLGQLTWGPCPPKINISSITKYSNTTIDVSYYIEPNNNEVDEVILLYSLDENFNSYNTVNDGYGGVKIVDDRRVWNLEIRETYYFKIQLTSGSNIYQSETVSYTVTPFDDYCPPISIVIIGTQQWYSGNACNITYRDGTPIPKVTDGTDWSNLTTGAWCYYENDETKGKLYNWYAVMGIHDADPNTPNKEFAPEGWHVPSDTEWTTLEEHLIANGYNYDDTTTENKIAKAMASTTGWYTSTGLGAVGNDQSLNNDSGFNAFPEGYRGNSGSFVDEGGYAVFWSSTESSTSYAWYRRLLNDDSVLDYYYDFKQDGFSVRFVRD